MKRAARSSKRGPFIFIHQHTCSSLCFESSRFPLTIVKGCSDNHYASTYSKIMLEGDVVIAVEILL